MTEEEIFHKALAKVTPEECAAFLDRACAGSPKLRASVAALLKAHASAGGFLERPPVPGGGAEPPDDLPAGKTQELEPAGAHGDGLDLNFLGRSERPGVLGQL